MRTATVLALACLLGAAASHAEINIVDSLEWMAVDAALVVKAKVVGYEETKGPGAVVYRDISLRVEEALKGELKGERLAVRRRDLGPDTSTLDQWKDTGRSLLFFLRPGRASDDKRLAGRWVLRESRQSLIDLRRPARVYKADGTFARDAAEILRIVRRYATRKKPDLAAGAPNVFRPQAGYVRMEIEPSAPIFRSVYAGSACYINVPVEPEHRALALAKARDQNPHVRAAGADLLRNFPGPQTLRILAELLADPGEAKWSRGAGELVRIAYPARRAAYDALRALGATPAGPPFERQPTPAEVKAFRDAYWANAVRQAIRDHKKTWHVSVEGAVAPPLWTRTHGGEGLAVRCVAPRDVPDLPRDAPRPAVTLYLMPRDWSGENELGNGEKLLDGKYTVPDRPGRKAEAAAARYLGSTARRHHFLVQAHVPKGWAFDRYIQAHFHLTIANAYIQSTGIRKISEHASSYAHRNFSSDGWVHASHMSGDPRRPRVYQDELLVPQPRLVAIWRAAAALDRKLLDEKHDPKSRHHHHLEIAYASGRRIVVGWPRGAGPKDAGLKRLLALLRETGYGAW